MTTPTTSPATETCGACGSAFADLSEVFSHPCSALKISRIGLGVSPAHRPQGTGSAGAATTISGATDKQVAFIARLAAERGVDVPEVTTKAQASAAIDALLAQPVTAAQAAPSASPTVRTNRYAGRCGHCGSQVPEGEGRIDKLDGRWVTYHLDTQCPEAAESRIVNRESGTRARITEDGFYLNPETDEVFKVQVAHHGSGGLYAKRLVLPAGGVERGAWTFERGLIAKLDPAWKLTLEQAQAWGRLYGYCCRCAAILTDETSIERGLGPICAGKFAA